MAGQRDVITILEDIAAGGNVSEGQASADPAVSTFFVIEVPTESTPIDLSGAAYEGLLSAIQAGKTLELQADFNMWFRWGTATGTVDETKTAEDTPLNQARPVFACERLKRKAPVNTDWLMVKGEEETYLRITVLE